MRAGNRGQFSLMPQALDTTSCSFVYKCYSSIGIGCFTQLHRNIYEAFRSSAASYLEIILLIHFPQVLTNSSTSALTLSITDSDILKRKNSFFQIIQHMFPSFKNQG